MFYYDVTYKCSKCGKTFHRKEHTDKKPTIINNLYVRTHICNYIMHCANALNATMIFLLKNMSIQNHK